MDLQFDTARVNPRERAGFWREVVCSVYVPMNAEPLLRQPFHARMDVRAARGRVYSAVDAGPQRAYTWSFMRHGHHFGRAGALAILLVLLAGLLRALWTGLTRRDV